MKIDYKSFKKKYIRPTGKQFPTGSKVYKGFQGSGKTLSMVHDTLELLREFPDCVIFSNVKIKGLPELHYTKYFDEEEKQNYYRKIGGRYCYIDNDYKLQHALEFKNGADGVIILIDEAHLFFNKKTGISLDVLTAISQQRKDRRRLVFTSQIWEELDVSLRKQVKEVVTCKCLFGLIQINTVSNGETIQWNNRESTWTAQKIRTEIFKHNQDLYDRYDTLQKIIKNNEYQREKSASIIDYRRNDNAIIKRK